MTTRNKNLPLFPRSSVNAEFNPMYHETTAYQRGYGLIAGVDEVGRGPLAGPVVAAAVIIPKGVPLPGVRDSKKMTEKGREEACSLIHEKALAVGVGVVSHRSIDESNILIASLNAMRQALLYLEPAPDFVLVDGIQKVPIHFPQKCIKKGDHLSRTISAASIVAKVYRDRIMRSYHDLFPEYGFDRNKGYGTKYHLIALQRHGPCPIHRRTFKGTGRN